MGEKKLKEERVQAKESSSSSKNLEDNKMVHKEKDRPEQKKSDDKLIQEIEIPEDVKVIVEDSELVVKKNNKELRRKLNPAIGLRIEEGKIVVKAKKGMKREKKIFGTFKAHIKNMIKGLTEGFKYKLQVSNVHFPMTVKYDKEKNEIVVNNFLGEKKDRRIKMTDNVDVKVDKDIIEIESFDIEKAGQSAANLEKGTKVRNKDRRVFQDGVFIISKPKREFI